MHHGIDTTVVARQDHETTLSMMIRRPHAILETCLKQRVRLWGERGEDSACHLRSFAVLVDNHGRYLGLACQGLSLAF